jgi:hypothetical protein
MRLTGCDFHPSFQQIAIAGAGDEPSGEKKNIPCRSLRRQRVQVGIEASGNTRWFECLLAEFGAGVGDGRGSAASGLWRWASEGR